MVRKQFPDIHWLKQTIRTRSEQKLGWPTCILNVRSSQDYRPDVCGPLSIFSNRSGVSYCEVDGHRVRIEPGQYFLSNRGQHYSLHIEDEVETMNIHVEEKLMEQVYRSLVTPEDQLLAKPMDPGSGEVNFFARLYPKDLETNVLIEEILRAQSGHAADHMLLEEQLYQLMFRLLNTHRDILKDIARLPARKAATREEIYARLSVARDYIHSHYAEELNLEAIAQNACMSRFHFLRLFKFFYGRSPYQYLKELRLEKARDWLSKGTLSVSDIAFGLGYQNISSFSRVFHQSTGRSPQTFRRGENFAILVK